MKIIPETELSDRRRGNVPDRRFSQGSKGSADVRRAAADTSRRKIQFDPATTTTVTHMQPTVGSPSIGSDVSMQIIPKYKYVKRKRKKGPQISSPFEEIEIGTRKRTKFEPLRKPSASELIAFKAWRDEHVPNELYVSVSFYLNCYCLLVTFKCSYLISCHSLAFPLQTNHSVANWGLQLAMV